MKDDGFIFRDAHGNKCWFIYADDRNHIYESREELAVVGNQDSPQTADTEEGLFYIIGSGAVQYCHAGFKTEELCGHRCQWRHVVYLGKPIQPAFVRSHARLI